MSINKKEKDDIKHAVERLLEAWKNQSLDCVVNLSVIDAIEELEQIFKKQKDS